MPLNSTPNLRTLVCVYLFSLGLIIGSAYTMYVHFDFSHSVDTKSYLKMAQGDFNVTVTHRYRVIIPALAAAVAWPLEQIYTGIWPARAETLWPLRLGFFLVNSTLLALVGLILCRTCQLYGATFWSSVIAITAVLTSRWAVYTAGLPLIDSLYLLVFALAIYGIKARSKWALVFCILIGPHAKESFIFLAPLLFFFGKNALSRPWQVLLFVASAILAYSVRYLIDQQIQVEQTQSINNALNHFNNILISIRRVFSPKGIGEVFSVFGIFTLVIFAGLLGGKAARQTWLRNLDAPLFWLLVIVLIHALLSSDIGRMSYLSAPAFAVACALILDRHPFFSFLSGKEITG
ncbi:hypothetical protein [Adhaeribacter soli]|uniref:DUF2029 domain-containing protein n=1 Tax=Adhaeribacter soli TaxID=2607655 RepID=A0A5N1IUW2_9BACT|nr:hypothetical protein [Adhaeribacter soli]KAA9333557.1 hypothetical protein F0P94_09885 [Adhaeribacter soli]